MTNRQSPSVNTGWPLFIRRRHSSSAVLYCLICLQLLVPVLSEASLPVRPVESRVARAASRLTEPLNVQAPDNRVGQQRDELIHKTKSLLPDEPTPLPPTELRIIYPFETDQQFIGVDQDFPKRIRVSSNTEPINDQPASAKSVLYQSSDNHVNDKGPAYPEVVYETRNSSVTDQRMPTQGQETVSGASELRRFHQGRSQDVNAIFTLVPESESSFTDSSYSTLPNGPADSSVRSVADHGNFFGTTISPYVIGNITVGALIGIITGVLTTVVLGVALIAVCHRRSQVAQKAKETDLQTIGSHYGSWWGNKAFADHQMNDQRMWSGDSQDEIFALDNDAFLKSLEDLGRVSSRPNSNNDGSFPRIDDRDVSTKV